MIEPTPPLLPMEVWVYVFKFLEAESLLRCQGVCAAWRTEILHMVHTGKIPRLGLCCERLVWSEHVLSEYKKSTWESLSLCVDKPVLLVGVVVKQQSAWMPGHYWLPTSYAQSTLLPSWTRFTSKTARSSPYSARKTQNRSDFD